MDHGRPGDPTGRRARREGPFRESGSGEEIVGRGRSKTAITFHRREGHAHMRMMRSKASRTASPRHRSPRSLRKVLVALDGSPAGEMILKHLEGILPPRATLLLVHVLPNPVPSSTSEVTNLLHLQEDAEEYLEGVRERFPRLRSKWVVETGDPVERILATAREEDVDALALTT
ncbi:MAG: universal stress protein, partial [Planctomycetota bacterium]